MSKLLINEPPLQLLPSLSRKIGIYEAIVFQQLHYWLDMSKNRIDGFLWVYNTIAQWNDQFPWSESTTKRTLKSLRDKGLIIAEHLNPDRRIRDLYYRIDYDALERLEQSGGNSIRSSRPNGSGLVDPMDQGYQPLSSLCTETTTENTTETTGAQLIQKTDLVKRKEPLIDWISGVEPDDEASWVTHTGDVWFKVQDSKGIGYKFGMLTPDQQVILANEAVSSKKQALENSGQSINIDGIALGMIFADISDWYNANPQKQKTKAGLERFLKTWIQGDVKKLTTQPRGVAFKAPSKSFRQMDMEDRAKESQERVKRLQQAIDDADARDVKKREERSK